MLVAVAIFVLSGLMVASHYVRQSTSRVIDHELNHHGQAVNAAKAGLVDALCWYRRQTSQPVAAFTPNRDLGADPPINETDDPDIGLVREYQISTRDNLWGRYEVRRRVVRDTTAERNLAGVGRYWYIEAKGYVLERLAENYEPGEFYSLYEISDGDLKRKLGDGTYEVVDTAADGKFQEDYDERLVKVLASVTMGTEFRRLSVVPPADAAICAARGDYIRLEDRSRTNGHDSYGIVYPEQTGDHYQAGGAELSGSPARARVDPTGYSLEEIDVFGVIPQELQALSDIYTDDPSTLPEVLPDFSIIYIDSDVTWSAAKPLKGTALVYVGGDATMAAASSSYFSGILYVVGDFVQESPSLLNGTLMCKGRVTVTGSGDYSEMNFDKDVRSRILTISGQYRFSMPMYFVD